VDFDVLLLCGGQPVLRGGKLKIAESEDFGFRPNQIGSVDREAVLRSRPRNDGSRHRKGARVAEFKCFSASGSGCVMVKIRRRPSESKLIKNRATIVKCERPWTGTCSCEVDVGKEGARPL
jgi:hypothetical protein